jgi:hypothetical protein
MEAMGSYVFVEGEARATHLECGLREVIGGIGHLTNHEYWCQAMGDPDAGLTYRESAKQAWAYWLDNHDDA